MHQRAIASLIGFLNGFNYRDNDRNSLANFKAECRDRRTQSVATEANTATSGRNREVATSQLSESLKRISPGLRVDGSDPDGPTAGHETLRSELRELAFTVRLGGRASTAHAGDRTQRPEAARRAYFKISPEAAEALIR